MPQANDRAERISPIRIVVADDAYRVREALKHLLEGSDDMAVVGEFEDGDAVLAALDRQRADLLISDIRMPPSGNDEGIRLAARLRNTHPGLGVIVLSTWADPDYAIRLFDGGCDRRGYLLKDRIRDRAQIGEAVRTVAGGGAVIDPKVIEDLLRCKAGAAVLLQEQLTQRELETLVLVAEGQSNAAIAQSLGLSKPAVEMQVDAIFAKLQLPDPQHASRRVKSALLYLANPSSHSKPRLEIS